MQQGLAPCNRSLTQAYGPWFTVSARAAVCGSAVAASGADQRMRAAGTTPLVAASRGGRTANLETVFWVGLVWSGSGGHAPADLGGWRSHDLAADRSTLLKGYPRQ
jgi:hypothetical protein